MVRSNIPYYIIVSRSFRKSQENFSNVSFYVREFRKSLMVACIWQILHKLPGYTEQLTSSLRNGRQFILSCSSIHCVIISCNVNYSLRVAILKATWVDRNSFSWNHFSFISSSTRLCFTLRTICLDYFFLYHAIDIW